MLRLASRAQALSLTIALLCACRSPAREPPKREARSSSPAAEFAAAAKAPATPATLAEPVRLFAKRFVVKVREAPSKDAYRIGYLRGGAVVQAKTATPIGFDHCRKGWFELEGGGFICSTVDAIAFLGRRLPERQSLQPDPTAPLPYPYAYSRQRNTPVYRRVPTDDEAALYEGTGPTPPPLPVNAVAEAAPALQPGASSRPELTAALAPDGPEDAVPTLGSLLGEQGSVLARRMERGFFVSLDRELTRGASSYFRTQSNGFIPSGGLQPVVVGEFHGVRLQEQGIALPIGFVMSNKSHTYAPGRRGGLRRSSPPGYHHMFPIASTLDLRGTRYLVDSGGVHYREKDCAVIARREKPAEVAADENWIDVDLGAQALVAYVGETPVFATLISSGRIKDELDPQKNFETPAGAYRITSKHLTATMDGDHAIDGPYSIEDVPYVMYFQLAYALHAAFWHNAFGRPRSHGCINLSPLDAKWLFEFAEPPMRRGWHGVYPNPEGHGTRLYVHGQTPQG